MKEYPPLKPSERKVLYYLTKRRLATVYEIAEDASLSTTRVRGLLQRLQELGLVVAIPLRTVERMVDYEELKKLKKVVNLKRKSKRTNIYVSRMKMEEFTEAYGYVEEDDNPDPTTLQELREALYEI